MSKLTVLCSYNMSWVHEDQVMLAKTQGIPFWSSASFSAEQEMARQTIVQLTDKVVEKNLKDEIELAQSGKGLPQTPMAPSKEMTEETIENMTRPQVLKLLAELEFPTSKLNVAEAKDILKKLFTESLELRKALVEAAYGNKSL